MVGSELEQQQQQQQQFWSIGSEVEVSSDDEGFRGAWFRATIVDWPTKLSSSSKKRKETFVVCYKTLLTDDGSGPLTEEVDQAHIRPLPPVTESAEFEENDVVDAFYLEGWWTGVVVRKIPESERFLVYFKEPPDVFEFERNNLRLHWDWVGGDWLRLEKQELPRSTFSTGAAVEVNIGEEKSCGAWVPATFIKEIDDNTFLVKCENSSNSDDSGFLKVSVDFLHIRPPPPACCDQVRRHSLLEKVEAYSDCGWRAGVITKVLTGEKYIVYFKSANEAKEFFHKGIRPHMEWIDGKWISNSKEVLDLAGHKEEPGKAHGTDNPEMPIQVDSLGIAKDNNKVRTPCTTNPGHNLVETIPCNGSSNSDALTPRTRKTKQATMNVNDIRSRPFKKLKEGNATEASLFVTPCKSRTTIKRSTKTEVRGLATPTMRGTGTRYSKQFVVGDQPLAKTQSPFQEKKSRTKQWEVGELDIGTADLVERKGRSRKLEVKTPQASVADMKGNAGIADLVKKKGISRKLQDKTPEASVADMKGNAEIADLVNKKERARKLQVKRPQASVADKEGNVGFGAAEEITEKEVVTKVQIPVIIALQSQEDRVSDTESAGRPENQELLKLMKGQNPINDPEGDKYMETRHQSRGGSSQKRKRGRPRKLLILNSEASAMGEEHDGATGVLDEMVIGNFKINEAQLPTIAGVEFSDAVKERVTEAADKNGVTKEVEMHTAGMSNNTADDDQPLSTWFGGMHSPAIVHESRLSPSGTVNQRTEGREKQAKIAKLSPTCAAITNTVADNNQGVPLAKHPHLWQSVESMQVFKVMPQKPHFRSLYSKYGEDYVEGQAVAMMVSFANVFKKISTLPIDGPRSSFVSYLEGLPPFEENGFDVEVLRNHVTRLLTIKDRQDQFREESVVAERKMEEHTHENAKLDEAKDDIVKKINDLQEALASIESKRKKEGDEISRLRSYMDGINKNIQDALVEYEEVLAAAAPWRLG